MEIPRLHCIYINVDHHLIFSSNGTLSLQMFTSFSVTMTEPLHPRVASSS
ncbi:hypothetical protein KDX00_15480 [Cobetia amphilecti]|nr:hypothetical protein KDX00_15480 [Cobetia litoralis]